MLAADAVALEADKRFVLYMQNYGRVTTVCDLANQIIYSFYPYIFGRRDFHLRHLITYSTSTLP